MKDAIKFALHLLGSAIVLAALYVIVEGSFAAYKANRTQHRTELSYCPTGQAVPMNGALMPVFAQCQDTKDRQRV